MGGGEIIASFLPSRRPTFCNQFGPSLIGGLH